MKILSMIAVLFTSALAFAYPALNDSITYSGTFTQETQAPIPVTLQMQLVQYDASKDSYLRRKTVTAQGDVQTEDQWIKTSDLMSPAQVQQVLAGCVSAGGHFEDVIVGTETVHTCALPINSADEIATYWIGDVPFGIVKTDSANSKDKTHTVLSLQSHSN